MKKQWILTIWSLIIGGLVTFCWLSGFKLLWQISFTLCFVLTLVALFLGKLKFAKLYKPTIALFYLEVFLLAVYSVLFYTGLLVHFETLESTQAWFRSFGATAWLIFFLIQLAQVVVLPIPAQLTTVAGTLIFGGGMAFLISTLAVILGSIIAFAIGRKLGVDIAIKISDKQTVDKYRNLLTKKGILFLPIMFIFPLFPDDLLCFIAGTTKMSWLYFLIVTVISRPIGLGAICLFGSGDIIPFSGWGIPVWIIIFILLAVVAFFLLKYQEKIIEWTIKTFGKKTKYDNLINGKQASAQAMQETSTNLEPLTKTTSQQNEYNAHQPAIVANNDITKTQNIDDNNLQSSNTEQPKTANYGTSVCDDKMQNENDYNSISKNKINIAKKSNSKKTKKIKN
jgi:uncharacterized membrane protein YdjX (TVP38/TMEM64 family)